MHGKTTRTPRNFGTTMLINGYCDFLKERRDCHSGYYIHPEYENWDDSISILDMMDFGFYKVERLQEFAVANPKMFKREYNVKLEHFNEYVRGQRIENHLIDEACDIKF